GQQRVMTFRDRYLLPIVESRIFSAFTTWVIISYAVILGLKTIKDISPIVELVFQYLDYAVTVYFIIEIIIKMLAEEKFYHFFKKEKWQGWNIFDFLIVAISLIPLDMASSALVARLLRVFRVLRLFHSAPRLKAIINILFAVIPSIKHILLLLFIMMYVYAIVASLWFQSLPSGAWDNVLSSLLTLFQILTFEGWVERMDEAMKVYPYSWIYFVSFIIVAGFVFFNFFIGIIIDEMQKLNRQAITDELQEEEKKLDEISHELSAHKSESNKKLDRMIHEIRAIHSQLSRLEKKLDKE
ncbi:MAG: ion transporter, partial [Spirochaetota bacterium]|nr:ion transporter [Spirochaetota bacterium]